MHLAFSYWFLVLRIGNKSGDSINVVVMLFTQGVETQKRSGTASWLCGMATAAGALGDVFNLIPVRWTQEFISEVNKEYPGITNDECCTYRRKLYGDRVKAEMAFDRTPRVRKDDQSLMMSADITLDVKFNFDESDESDFDESDESDFDESGESNFDESGERHGNNDVIKNIRVSMWKFVQTHLCKGAERVCNRNTADTVCFILFKTHYACVYCRDSSMYDRDHTIRVWISVDTYPYPEVAVSSFPDSRKSVSAVLGNHKWTVRHLLGSSTQEDQVVSPERVKKLLAAAAARYSSELLSELPNVATRASCARCLGVICF